MSDNSNRTLTEYITGRVRFGNGGLILDASQTTGLPVLQVTNSGSNITLAALNGTLSVSGTVSSQDAGNAVLVAGTVTVADTSVDASTEIFLSRKVIGGTVGNLSYTISAGVGFTITSSSSTDTSTVSYLRVN